MSTKHNIDDATFIVCDVETTGLSAFENRITEIALIKIEDGEISDRFTTLINPKQYISSFITNLTGITNEDVFDKPEFSEISDKIIEFMDIENPLTIFCGHNVSFDYKFLKSSFERMETPATFNFQTLCTCKLARRIFPSLKSKSLENVAAYLGIKQRNKHRAYDDTLTTAKILLKFFEILQNEYDCNYLEDVMRFQNTKIYSGNKKPPALRRIKMKMNDVPEESGVYFMKSRSEEILYIGKAKNLRDRVSSYFRHNEQHTDKIKKMLTQVASLEFQITDSELSALILESKMIKFHKPRFNTAIKRFRFHPFIKLDIQNEFPKIESVYEIENDGAYYYGPFSSRATVRTILKDIKENFKIRKCESKLLRSSKNNSNCLYFDIGICDAPCNETITKDVYSSEVLKVHNYITGMNGQSMQTKLLQLMKEASEQMNYERAAYLRDRYNDLNRVMSYAKVITSAINNKKLVIKCDSENKRELFFIHNGKLLKTYTINKSDEFDQTNILNDLNEYTEYLYFTLNKYAQHKYTMEELDEIKVISNWLAVNRDRSKFIEISDDLSKEDIIKFMIR